MPVIGASLFSDTFMDVKLTESPRNNLPIIGAESPLGVNLYCSSSFSFLMSILE